MLKIALISASNLPLPATRGGATETMMTHLLNENEISKKIHITVFSYYEQKAYVASKEYKNASFHFYKFNKHIDVFYTLPSRLLRKLTNGKTYLISNFIKFCIKHLRNEKFDAVIVEGNHFQVLQLNRGIDDAIILHMHIDGLHLKTDNGRNILNACTGVFAISEYCRKRIVEINPIAGDKVFTLKNTIDTGHFNSENYLEFRKSYREEHKISNEQKVIVYCGRLEENKGVYELIEAFKILDDKTTILMIIGSSFYMDGNKTTKYINKLKKAGESVKKRIIFTGYIPQSNLPKYYSVSDIAVVPSTCQEAAGNVTIEALSCGLPVIASRRGGIPEYASVEACLLVECDDNFISNLHQAVEKMVSDEEFYLLKKSHAREIAQQYNKRNYYVNFYNLISHIIQKNNKK